MKFLNVLQIVVTAVLFVAAQSDALGCHSNGIQHIFANGELLEVSDMDELVESLKNYRIPQSVNKVLDSIKIRSKVIFADTDRAVVKESLGDLAYGAECSDLNSFLKPLIESCPDDVKKVTLGVKNRMKRFKEIDSAYGAALVCSCLAEISLEKNSAAGNLDDWKFWGNLY